jgi:tetrapyrrole methylase family protein / MazG family protein
MGSTGNGKIMKTALENLKQMQGIEKLVQVVAQLRHPTDGCPWDLKQTHQSLKPYMLEEAYEAVEAVDEADAQSNPDVLKEELGDVLLQVVLHSQLAKDAGTFDFDSVCETIAEKLIRRHPHVFGTVDVANADDVVVNWDKIKQAEKAEKGQTVSEESILHGVSKNQPALSRALETSKRAVKVGFEWPDLESLWQCVMSEYDEFRAEIGHLQDGQDVPPDAFDRLESEMGDIFFASVNLARTFKIDPEIALTKATAKFTKRFQTMEQLVKNSHGQGLPLDEQLKTLDFETWDALWNEAKARCDS